MKRRETGRERERKGENWERERSETAEGGRENRNGRERETKKRERAKRETGY